ncbi:MAG: OmpA family protein, partial [Pseudomonadota bacterium]
NIALSNGLESDVKIGQEVDKKVITISDRVLFAYRTNTISKDGVRFLTPLSRILKQGSGLIQLRGYTSNEETILSPDPSGESMYLSVKRALAVLHFLIDIGKIPANKIVAHGFISTSMNEVGSSGKEDRKGR